VIGGRWEGEEEDGGSVSECMSCQGCPADCEEKRSEMEGDAGTHALTDGEGNGVAD